MNREHTEVLMELNINGIMDTAYNYGDQGLTNERFTEWTGYYTYDPRGSVTGVTDEKGMIWQSYRYDAFGSLTFGQPQYNNVYSYNAESYNPNVDAQYLRARYYSVGTGNFLTEDEFWGRLVEPLSLNRYNYVASSPLNYKDPSGNDWRDWLPWNWGKDKKKEEKNKKPIETKETTKETKEKIEIETAESKSEAIVCTTKEYDYYFKKYGTNVKTLITQKQLSKIFNKSSCFLDNDVYVFNAVLKENQINTVERMQYFFAKAIVETASGESLHEKYDKKYDSPEEAFRARDNHKYNNIEQYFNNSSDPMVKQQVNDGAKNIP